MRFSLVTTVFNEAARLDQTLQDLINQTVLPDEIVIVDAGSKDGTISRLEKFRDQAPFEVKVIVKERCNVAEGRNRAILEAAHVLIVSTDFGCRYHPNWLESLIKPFENDSSVEVVGGLFTVLEESVQTIAAKSDWVLQNGYRVIMDDNFAVSSRSIAYKKHVWKEIGGYPEWLTLAADDLVFWKLILKHNFKYVLVDKPFVYWMRHATNKQFGKEAFRYGLGDGEARTNKRNFYSNLIETTVRYIFFAWLLTLPLTITIFGGYALGGLTLVPGLRSYRHAFKMWLKHRSVTYNFKVLLNAFWQIELSRYNYLKGYLKGRKDNDIEKTKGREMLLTKLKP